MPGRRGCLAPGLALLAAFMAGYEAARAAAAGNGVVLAYYGALAGLETRLFGAPLALILAEHRSLPLDLVLGTVYLSHPVYVAAVLLWLCSRRPGLHRAYLASLAVASSAALVAYFLAPTAPPWIALPGLTRTPYPLLQLLGPEGRVDPNPYAAFPSMHVAVAVLTAGVLSRAGAGRQAWAWPVLMALATVYTGNHYLVDAAAGFLLGYTSLRAGLLLAESLGREKG